MPTKVKMIPEREILSWTTDFIAIYLHREKYLICKFQGIEIIPISPSFDKLQTAHDYLESMEQPKRIKNTVIISGLTS